MARKENRGDNMSLAIERIIEFENSESNAFMEKQRERIKQLKAIELNMTEKEKEEIISQLRDAGILDENGDLAAPYNYSLA